MLDPDGLVASARHNPWRMGDVAREYGRRGEGADFVPDGERGGDAERGVERANPGGVWGDSAFLCAALWHYCSVSAGEARQSRGSWIE